MHTFDRLGRPLRRLRLSVTDRCNLRCRYCMPEDQYTWIPRQNILTFEEISILVDVFVALGVDTVRLTGGEPCLRRNLPALVKILSAKSGIGDLAMTTNGTRLARSASALAQAGLGRVTVSLDTLRRDRFKGLTKTDALETVLEGINEARRAGIGGLKINTVVMRGFNDDELIDLLEFGKGVEAQVRFIEYMDVGGATRWSMPYVVSKAQMLNQLAGYYGTIEPLAREAHAPAERFRLPDSTEFGIISSTTSPFCCSCNRSRLTADGMWYLCLYAPEGMNLKSILRSGASHDTLASLIESAWQRRTDRGAEKRLSLQNRAPLLPAAELAGDHHMEMHTRGG